MAVVGLGDIHVHADVMLTGHHFSGTARPFGDLGMVERLDHVGLLERARLRVPPAYGAKLLMFSTRGKNEVRYGALPPHHRINGEHQMDENRIAGTREGN